MNTRLYVGNLSASVTEDILQQLFSKYGVVTELKWMTDSAGRFRGTAYVTMATPEAAKTAVDALHSHGLGGRYITVHEARPEQEDRLGSRIGDVDPRRSNSKLR